MHPKVLIVGTSPYSTSGTSRTFDSCFHFWERDRVAQIFSRNWVPSKGHCGELFQITDAQLLKRWLHQVKDVGKVYCYEDLVEQSGIHKVEETSLVRKLYSYGEKHYPTIELMRRVVWRKKYWCTQKLKDWLDRFQPECVVYSYSNHVFFQQVALFVADRFGIPIVTKIGDDFYFNDSRLMSPAHLLFKKMFKKLTERILLRKASFASFDSEKVKEKYNGYFHLEGSVVYANSTLVRREFKEINIKRPRIVYFGSVRLGRSVALLEIADALGKINPDYKLEVYTGENDATYFRALKSHPNVLFKGFVPYTEIVKIVKESDIYVIAEGFANKDIRFTRYSLSTKTADSLAAGIAILVYGPKEAGVVSYMNDCGAAAVCSEPADLKRQIEMLLYDVVFQKSLYEHASATYKMNHIVENTTKVFESIIDRAIEVNKTKRGS